MLIVPMFIFPEMINGKLHMFSWIFIILLCTVLGAMVSTMLLMISGPILYMFRRGQGDRIEYYKDLESLNAWREMLDKGLKKEEALRCLKAKSRDNARTPMQWNDEPGAGFTSGEPWIKINPNYHRINAENDIADPDGIFAYYQQLIRLRAQDPLLVEGIYELLLPDDPEIFAYFRRGEQASIFGSLQLLWRHASLCLARGDGRRRYEADLVQSARCPGRWTGL